MDIVVGTGSSYIPDTYYPDPTCSSSTDSNDGTSEREYKKPKSGTGKEKASDIPSWARGERPYKDESGKDFAKRLLDKKYGKDNYKTGPNSEYNKLKKWGDRGFE